MYAGLCKNLNTEVLPADSKINVCRLENAKNILKVRLNKRLLHSVYKLMH